MQTVEDRVDVYMDSDSDSDLDDLAQGRSVNG